MDLFNLSKKTLFCGKPFNLYTLFTENWLQRITEKIKVGITIDGGNGLVLNVSGV